jgi:prophage maintenance system killer protein
MRYLSLGEIVDLHQSLLDQSGGPAGIRDLGGLESRWRNRAPRSAARICTQR